jgi:hypothetical protein
MAYICYMPNNVNGIVHSVDGGCPTEATLLSPEPPSVPPPYFSSETPSAPPPYFSSETLEVSGELLIASSYIVLLFVGCFGQRFFAPSMRRRIKERAAGVGIGASLLGGEQAIVAEEAGTPLRGEA